MKTWIHAALLGAAVLVAGPCLGDESKQRSITVSGEASGQVAPDQAVLNISLVSRDVNLQSAKRKNDMIAEKVLTVCTQFNIPKEKIATSGVYISPQYDYNNGEQTFRDYVINRSLRITMDTADAHEKLLSALVEAKVDQVNGFEFKLADPEKASAPLRVKAFENAKVKAEALAQAAGSKLGPALLISTEAAQMIQPRPMMAMKMAMAESSSAPSLPGLIDLREAVTVTFALE